MALLSSIWSVIVSIFSYLWWLFLIWLGIFIAPFYSFDLLWITIPVWLSWFFADYFQEKKGTSFGNAVSNGIIPIWVGIDWTRFLVNSILDEGVGFSWLLAVKFTLCLLVLVYGITVVYLAVQAKSYAKYIGRIREVTYVLIVVTPVIYGVTKLSWTWFTAVLLFFPAFYFGVELLFNFLPNPRVIDEDEGGSSKSFKF